MIEKGRTSLLLCQQHLSQSLQDTWETPSMLRDGYFDAAKIYLCDRVIVELP